MDQWGMRTAMEWSYLAVHVHTVDELMVEVAAVVDRPTCEWIIYAFVTHSVLFALA